MLASQISSGVLFCVGFSCELNFTVSQTIVPCGHGVASHNKTFGLLKLTVLAYAIRMGPRSKRDFDSVFESNSEKKSSSDPLHQNSYISGLPPAAWSKLFTKLCKKSLTARLAVQPAAQQRETNRQHENVPQASGVNLPKRT